MDSPFFLILVGLLYIVLFGGLSLLRREGLSIRFALESLTLIAIFSIFSFLTGQTPNPVIFLAVLYLITMRSKILVDLAIFFARRGKFGVADYFYFLASKVWPDHANRLNIQINQATTCIQKGSLDEAISILNKSLDEGKQGDLGLKHEAAAHFNLGVAYLKKKNHNQARNEFLAVIETAPASIFARRAEEALKKNRPPED